MTVVLAAEPRFGPGDTQGWADERSSHRGKSGPRRSDARARSARASKARVRGCAGNGRAYDLCSVAEVHQRRLNALAHQGFPGGDIVPARAEAESVFSRLE